MRTQADRCFAYSRCLASKSRPSHDLATFEASGLAASASKYFFQWQESPRSASRTADNLDWWSFKAFWQVVVCRSNESRLTRAKNLVNKLVANFESDKVVRSRRLEHARVSREDWQDGICSMLERECVAQEHMRGSIARRSRQCTRHEHADHGWNRRSARWSRGLERTVETIREQD
ncbi:hypothetical protein M5K25_021911 [Dendrobium thyrsiflorum]|uniref:Uncharacterized protein n=1 Tax=Dendrobium thyrsiflorum TaxID=117978 RepID=A0ABD0UAS7_DENTH